MPTTKIPISTMPPLPPQGIYIFARGTTAPIVAVMEGSHIIVTLRSGGTLGVEDKELSRKFEWASDKLRELMEKGVTRL